MNRIFKGAQPGDLWFKARVGRITGSRIPDLLAAPTTRKSVREGVECLAGTEALDKAKYRRDLVVERIYGQAVDHPTNQRMRDGTDREPFARMLYEAEEGVAVEQISLALHPEWDWFGVSVDGLVGERGGLEIKSPSEVTHDSYSQNISLLVEEYKGQVLAALLCFPEREWWDLVSFHPYAPESIKLLRAPRFHRSDWAETLARIEDEAQKMNAEVEAEIQRRGFPPTIWRVMPDQTKEEGA